MPTSLLASLRGARVPRVNSHPPYVDTFGPEAVELAASAGLVADPWQVDSVDLMLSLRHDDKWACYEYAEIVGRQNGKGSIGEIRVLAGLYLLGERLIMWSAHEYKTAMEAFLRVRSLIDNTDDLRKRVKRVSNTHGEEGIELLTGQRLRFLARSKGSGRGFSGDVNILDEAFAYTLTQQAALMPTMSARPNPQIVYLSSPPLDGESGEVLFNLRKRGDRTAPREVEDGPWRPDGSLGWRDWGLPGNLADLRGIDLDSRGNWAATNPALGYRITEETIARERRSMGVQEFARERLGIWPFRASSAGGVLDPQAWAGMLDPDSRRSGDVALSWDVTPMRDHASIGMYGARDDGREHMQLVDYRPGTGWIVDRLVELRDTLDPICFVVDAKNGGASLLDDLAERGISVPEDPEQPRRGDVLVLDTSEASDAVGQYIDAFRSDPPTIRHIGQEPLDTAVKNARTRSIGDAGQIAWGRRLSEVDIGPLVTVTDARYGWHAWRDQVTSDYDVLDSVF